MTDPERLAAALRATQDELAELRDPQPPVEYTERWAAAVAAEPGGRPALARWRRPRPALLAAAVLVAVLATAALWPRQPQPLDLAASGRAALGVMDAGPLADRVRLAGCLRSVAVPGVDPEGPLLGARSVELGGRPGVLLVLPGGQVGSFHVVVVDPGCGPGGGQVLRAELVGR